MREWLFLSLILYFGSFCNAQVHEMHPCALSKRSSADLVSTSSNKSISGQEKYDIHFVKLDVEVDNLSTEIEDAYALLKATVTSNSLDLVVLELASTLNVSYAFINGNNAIVSRFGDELSLQSNISYNQGDELEIEVFYSGIPPSGNGNSGGVYNQFSGFSSNITYTLSQPFSSKTWWPCKQVLTDRIDSSEVWLTIPSSLKGGANGLLKNETDLGNGKVRFEWEHKHSIVYYLISYAVGDFLEHNFYAPLPNTTEQVLIQNYLHVDWHSSGNLILALEETSDMMYVFSDLFGLYPYRNEKYGHCTVPSFGWSMEHQTMTSLGDASTRALSHELAHQWFGNHVAVENWGHIWLSEGFASYGEYLYQWHIDPVVAAENMDNLYARVMNNPTGSVFIPLNSQMDRSRIFDNRLTYDKGSALVHMIRHWVNNDVLFFNALKSFQNNYANSTANAEDFIAEIEIVTGTDMSRFLEHWFYGEGHPTYSGTYNNLADGIVLELNQGIDLNSVTPFYKSHLELKVEFVDGSDTILYLVNNFNNEQYFFPIIKAVDTIIVDPNNWILNEDGGFLKDDRMIFTDIIELESNSEPELKIFPNPCKENLKIQLKSKSLAKLQIFNQLGEMVFEAEIREGVNNLKLALTTGVYFVRCEIEDEFYYQQLFVE